MAPFARLLEPRLLGPRLLGPQRRHLWFWVFTGPFVIGLVVFGYLPLLWSLWLSFFDAQNTVTPTRFVGPANYLEVLSDPAFRSSIGTFVVFAVFIVPTTFVCSLGLALLVHAAGPLRTFFRSVFFLPAACSYVVAGLIWKMAIFNGVRFGLANTVLRALGLDPVAWLATEHPAVYWVPIVTARLWLQTGFYMLLFLAGLARIPPTLYEAAALDGAQLGWRRFRYITFPQLRATSVAVALLLAVNAFQSFDEFFTLLSTARGYPPYARPPLVYLYYVALGQGQNLGVGSAGAVVLALVILVVTATQARWLRPARAAAAR